MEAPDVDSIVELFNRRLNDLLTQFAPKSRKKPKPIWSNSRLRTLKRKRASALKIYCRNRNEFTKRNFSRASNRYRSYNRYLYSGYVLRKQRDLKTNPKRFWLFVEKRKDSGLPAQMVYGESTSSSLDETAICLPSTFLVFSRLVRLRNSKLMRHLSMFLLTSVTSI